MLNPQPQKKISDVFFHLNKSLSGRTVFASRNHEFPNKENFKSNACGIMFGTLHAIAHRVVNGCNWDSYANQSIWTIMEQAVRIEFKIENPPHDLINKYYCAYRYLKNGNYTDNPYVDLNTDLHWSNIFKTYVTLKNDKFDYEDTFKQSIYFLQQHSGNLSFFNDFENFVLVNFEKLLEPSNANALNFYILLCKTLCTNKICTCIAVTSSLEIYIFDGNNNTFRQLNTTTPNVLAFSL